MPEKKKRGMGLLPRLLLGVFIPILIVFVIIGAVFFVSFELGPFRMTGIQDIGAGGLEDLNLRTLKEAQTALNQLGEKIVREKAQDAALQLETYFNSRPGAVKESDPVLKAIAVQRFGEYGSISVYDSRGVVLFDTDPKEVGKYLNAYAQSVPAFWKIVEVSLAKQPASGYYNWKEENGAARRKYMAAAPVKGADLIISASTYFDDFLKPTRIIEDKIKEIEGGYAGEYQKKIQIFVLIVLASIILLFVVIYFYARSVIRPILYLSEVADKISMGELDTPILVQAKGEVGVLVESLERMQTSIKAAIERLQRRKEIK